MISITPNGRKSFTLDSGRLLVADAYYLGYPKETLDEISKQRRQAKRRALYIEQGVLYHYPEDSTWNIYQRENGLWVVRANSDSTEREIIKKYPEPTFHTVEQYYGEREEIERKIKGELRRRGFLFWATTDLCELLVGDQKHFGIPKSEYSFSGRRYREHETERFTENHQRVADVEPGEYACKSVWNGLEINLL